MRGFMRCQVKVDELDGVCGNCGREEKCVQGFGLESRGRKTAWKNLGADGCVI
jgi:hypothetical protein